MADWTRPNWPYNLVPPEELDHFVSLDAGTETRIYYDTTTHMLWREELCNGPSTWSFYKLPLQDDIYVEGS